MVSYDISLNMKTILILYVFTVFKICLVSNQKMFPPRECIPLHYHWQPFYGAIPFSAMQAGVDRKGERKFVARIVSSDGHVWSSPTTISKSILRDEYLYFGWEDKGKYCKITEYIEIMIEGSKRALQWYPVRTQKDLFRYQRECCLVEGGYSYIDNIRVNAYVGRKYEQGSPFVGGVYINDWLGRNYIHYMVGWHSKFAESGYDILAYDCCHNVKCIPPSCYYNPCCANYYARGRQIRGPIS